MQDFSNNVLSQHAVQPRVDQRRGHHADEMLPPVIPLHRAALSDGARDIVVQEILEETAQFADLLDGEDREEGGERIIPARIEPARIGPHPFDMPKQSLVLFKAGLERRPG